MRHARQQHPTVTYPQIACQASLICPLDLTVVYESCGRWIWRRIAMPRHYLTNFREGMVRRMLAVHQFHNLF
jgi:hypothetical protein